MNKIFNLRRSNLDREIDDVISGLRDLDEGTEEYEIVLENLEKLHKIKNLEKSNKISPDTIAVVVGNLVGILVILNYERTEIVASKALGFVLRGRV